MIPISDDNPTIRTPVITIVLLVLIAAVWLVIQRAGFDPATLEASVRTYGLTPRDLTSGRANTITAFTPLTSMFLHGGWGHILGNGLFLWVFGNNVEDSMGRARFLVFYLLCGVAAAGAQLAIDYNSAIPMVGASGAISGVLGAYLVLYPRVRVNMLFFIFIFVRVVPLPAWAVLLWWIAWQVVAGLPQLTANGSSGGVAVWAHVGGFVAGLILVKLFEDKKKVRERNVIRHRLHPRHP
jgi:membrane associated rhomboid family serine protease